VIKNDCINQFIESFITLKKYNIISLGLEFPTGIKGYTINEFINYLENSNIKNLYLKVLEKIQGFNDPSFFNYIQNSKNLIKL